MSDKDINFKSVLNRLHFLKNDNIKLKIIMKIYFKNTVWTLKAVLNNCRKTELPVTE